MGLLDKIFGLLGSEGDERSAAGRDTSASGQTSSGDELVIEDRSKFGTEDHVPPGCLIGETVDDLREMADDYAGAWQEFGPTDYSVESIHGIDEMFATQQERANWLGIDLEDGRTGGFAPMAAQPACYFGEVLIRNYDAEWIIDYDYGWALAFKGETVVNLFGTVHRALDADPPFVQMHDTFVENYDLDGEPLDPTGERMAERRQSSGIEPDELSDETEQAADEQEPSAEEMQSFAEDFVESHPQYELDYSVQSLSAVDDVFDDKYRTDKFADAQLGSTDSEASIILTATASEAGGYFGEVIRRNTEAEWQHLEGDGLKLGFPSNDADIRVDPMATASSAIQDGDSFAESFDSILRAVESIDAELSESSS